MESKLLAALAKVKELIPVDLLSPKVAIVCGSGLSTLGSAIQGAISIPYADLPGFLTSQGMRIVCSQMHTDVFGVVMKSKDIRVCSCSEKLRPCR